MASELDHFHLLAAHILGRLLRNEREYLRQRSVFEVVCYPSKTPPMRKIERLTYMERYFIAAVPFVSKLLKVIKAQLIPLDDRNLVGMACF